MSLIFRIVCVCLLPSIFTVIDLNNQGQAATVEEFNLFRLDPDPIQGLEAFVERAGIKPYELF